MPLLPALEGQQRMILVTMSNKELARLRIIQDLTAKRIKPATAAQLLDVTTRQVRALRARFDRFGPAGLASQKRGKRSNRAYPEMFRRDVIDIVKANYPDFGPTFAAEKLLKDHGLRISSYALRTWMIAEGIWADRKARRKPVYQPRYRRDCFGELVQIDGSLHWWFEDRGPQCTLLVFIDDATSKLLQLRFVESESAFSYFVATSDYLQRHGKPIAFYSDKHSIFRVNRRGAVGGDGMTQFGRALQELNIDIICANSPQAKGRVERANRTLQDRLVKELRLAGISTAEEANKMLPAFMADYNDRFGKVPFNDKDLHRPLSPNDKLDDTFVWREERTVSASLTLQYDKVVFILQPTDVTRGLVRKRVTVSDYPDGRLIISHNGLPLAYSTFDKVRQVDQGAIVDNKRLSAVLSLVRAEQQQRPIHRSERGPRRRSQENSIFGIGDSISVKRRQRRRTANHRHVPRNPLPDFVAQRIAVPFEDQKMQSDTTPMLTQDDLLCLEIGRQVREEREAAMKAARALARADAAKPKKPLLGDPDTPTVLKYFRLGNRYLVQRSTKLISLRQGRPRKAVVPQLNQKGEAADDRIAAALVLAEEYLPRAA